MLIEKENGDARPYALQGCNRLLGWDASSTNGFAQPAPVFGSSTETIVTNQYLGELTVSNSLGGTAATPSVSDGTNFAAASFVVLPGSQEIVARVADTAGNIAQATNTASLTVVTNAAYAYNAAGCVTDMDYTDSQGGAYRTMDLTWNGQYQLTQVQTNGAFAESYQYDALGRRISTSNSAGIVYYVHDPAAGGAGAIHVIAEVDAAGSLTRSYTWGPGVDNLLAFTTGYGTASTNSYFALKDHLGTVHALADENGDIVESYRFDAWGRVVAVYDGDGVPLAQSAVGNRYLFQGREYSWATGLYYFRARWYDPITGRWLSKDPIGISGGLNQYAFCLSNPVGFVDADGLGVEAAAAAVLAEAAGAGAAAGGAAVAGAAGVGAIVGVYAGQGLDQYWKDCTGQSLSDRIGEALGNLMTPPSRTPAKGKPGSRDSFPDGRGGRTEREYGPDGRAIEDTDYGHNHGAGDPHKHKWDWNKDPPRQPGAPVAGLAIPMLRKNPYDEDPCK